MTTMDRNGLRFSFAALPGRVWEAMTNPDKAAVWLPGGWVAEVGRRFTLPGTGAHRISGEVIAVDPPSRVALRWRHTSESGAGTESVMTWVVAPAPGGASVQVLMAPIDDPSASADLVAALRSLFDVRLRSVLRGWSPARAAGAPSPAPSVPVDVAAPAGPIAPAAVEAASAGPVIEGRSQAVSLWPALRRAKGRSAEESRRSRTGPALALRLLAVIAVATAVAAITIGAAVVPWSTAPEESPLANDPGSSPAALDPATQANLGVGSPGSAGTVAGTGSAPTTGSTGITVPPLIPELSVTLQIVDRGALPLLTYRVNVAIKNSADVPQIWLNLTMRINGVGVVITDSGSLIVLLGGSDACFAPSASTSIGAGQTKSLSFKVTAVADLADPTMVRLNQGAC